MGCAAVTDKSRISEVGCNQVYFSLVQSPRRSWMTTCAVAFCVQPVSVLGSTRWAFRLLQFDNFFKSTCFHACYSGEDGLWRIMYWLSKPSPAVTLITSACISLAKANCMALRKSKVAGGAQKQRETSNRGEQWYVHHHTYSAS